MSVVSSSRSPANGTVNTTGSQDCSITWTCFDTILSTCYVYYRFNGGAWTMRTFNPQGASAYIADFGWTNIAPGDRIDWYTKGTNANGESSTTASWSISRAAAVDTTDPTLTSVTPATGNVSPGLTGVTFAATAADNVAVTQSKLYIDDVLEHTWGYGGALSHVTALTKGAHTYRFWCRDAAGNAAAPANTSITVVNVAPTVPSGTITVAGQTGAVEVANLGNIPVTWPAFLDSNPDDTLTYKVEEKIGAGSFTEVATGLATPAYEWTPNSGLGAAELRVRANDGTVDSAYLTRASISIVSSQSPTDPVLTAPNGGETWREGEVKDVTWTASTHPESLPITYEIQFSAAGDFSDAVVIATGVSASPYSWTLATTLVAANTATCKMRVRASDGYSKTSAWDNSNAAFTVNQNAVPVITLVSPLADALATGNTPYITVLVTDADSDPIHVEVMLSLNPSFSDAIYAKSALSWAGWEESASPFSTWTALPEAGTTTAYRVRWTCPALRYDVYFLKVRAFDGILYSEWSAVTTFRVTPSGTVPLTCSIGAYSYDIKGLKATEKTGGEGSPLEFRVPLSILATQPIARGASVSIGLCIKDQSRVWNATVENLVSVGAEVTVQCVQDDAYLARKLVTGDAVSQDVGLSLAGFVTSYGAPLANNHMDTSLGVTALITGQYKTLLDHCREWAQLLGLILWVDSDGEVHLTDPADLADPTYILHEAYL
jgi:hypothetical protein